MKSTEKCEMCGVNLIGKEEHTIFFKSLTVCDNCIDHVFTCMGCGDHFDDKIGTDAGFGWLCPTCMKEDFFKCRFCGKILSNKEADEDDNSLCTMCWDSLNEVIVFKTDKDGHIVWQKTNSMGD